ncbi:MAG: glycosyltransferase family 9 protein [Spartobacteria bacterium]|nr:glycosyltransferase family 9 protein [Spartobacteria bacterium]
MVHANLHNDVKTVLIIKLGYCETLVKEEGFAPSLGDVFRHTVLLHHYADYRVTWLTSASAAPLLRDNPFIDELLIFDESSETFLKNRHFTEVLCLEKAESVCRLVNVVTTDRHLGFGWHKNDVHAHPMAHRALAVANGKKHHHTIQELLYEMVGARWRGEDYILGYTPKVSETCDIGLNYKVGSKWPSKAWPMLHWQELEELCRFEGLSVSWQQGCTNLEEYMEWIAGCRLVVTCDSLGMHLGLAMKKKVIALFGPTPSEQIHMYNRGLILHNAAACPLAPCMQASCPDHMRCMTSILPTDVLNAIHRLIPAPVLVAS